MLCCVGRVLGASWGRLGGVFECLGGIWGRLGGVLRASWGILERLGGVLAASWSVLGRLGSVLGRRSVPFLIRKRAQNQTDIFWPKNVGLIFPPKHRKTYKNLRFFNDFRWLSIREVWEGGRRQGELPVGRGISTQLIGGRVL